jgi:hypothetical protein
MHWQFNGSDYTKLDKNVYGFIYKLYLSDGTMYVGKCDIMSTTTKPAKKDGSERPGHIDFFNKNVLIDPDTDNIAVSKKDKARVRKAGIKATRCKYETISKESDWREYMGSSEHVDTSLVTRKLILELLPTKRSLTYKEEWWQFQLDVLEKPLYLNRNIGNRYFRDKLL